MKKKILWVMAAILTCGSMFTSCTSNEDSPVLPPDLPDQTAMFIQNVLSDDRYYPDLLEIGAGGETAKFLRLDVADYDEAKAEFLKLLPEGVAATAFEEEFYQGMFDASTGYVLNNSQKQQNDSIVFLQVKSLMNQLVGLAWVELADDIQEALDVDFIIYMIESSNDDLENFVKCLMAIVPYSNPDPEDPSHLLCTITSEQRELVASFLTTKMMGTATVNESGDMEITLTDNAGNSYGKLIIVKSETFTDGASNKFVFDEDLQTSMAALIGGAFSSISFFLTEE